MPATRWLLAAVTAALALPLLFAARPFAAHGGLHPPLPAELAEGAGIVKSRYWAVALGKALFWDQQAGSDGMACASCHFHAGADSRITNQLTPGFLDVTKGPEGDAGFGSTYSETGEVPAGSMPSGALAGPNYTLTAGDFPLHRLADETDRDSDVRTTTNDRVSSAGAFDAEFTRVGLLGFRERCGRPSGEVFHAGGYAARQVEPRHTPTVINAVFNHRNFWDGRANNLFNGVGVFGLRDVLGDPDKRLLILENGQLRLGYLAIPDASLASQAVGPPLSALEMSCDGRTFADVARKLLLTRPLRLQQVHRQDSVLGPLAPRTGRGLVAGLTYATMITRAFEPRFWAAKGWYRIEGGQLRPALPLRGGYTQMEINFPMFWGIAIMLYEATLVSDRSEFDALLSTGRLIVNDGAGGFNCQAAAGAEVDPLLLRGCQTFFRVPFNPAARGAGCVLCHGGKDLFTTAGFQAGETFAPLSFLGNALGRSQIGDTGFFNIGLRPPPHDALAGGADPYGYSLSFARQYKAYGLHGTPVVDPALQAAIEAGTLPAIPFTPPPKVGVDGAAKTPTLRNVALTPPYFSFGGFATLRQVLKFYNRGGNRRAITHQGDPDALGSDCSAGDDSGTGPDGDHPWPVKAADCNTNASGLLTPLGLLDCDANGVESCDPATDDLAALERFLKSLTDRRVQCDQAPFDHPSLRVVDGHDPRDRNRDGKADDIAFELPAVGAGGYSPASGYCIPNAGDLFAPGMQARAGGPRVPLGE